MSDPEGTPGDAAEIRHAIQNLMFLYAEAIDAGDFEAIGRLFANARMRGPDGEVQGEGHEGIRAIYERSTRLYEDGTPRTQHVTTNLIVEPGADGRSADARSRFTVFQSLPDFPLQAIITGHYADRFEWNATDGWHFVERRMRPVLLGDLSRHLLYELD